MATTLYRSARAEDNGFVPRSGFRAFDLPDAESTLGERFREVAYRSGDTTAVVDGEHRIGYSQLLKRGETIAEDLRSRCGGAGGVVAICQPSRLAAIETILGALLGEFAYFCLDPSLPEPQKRKLLQTIAPVALEGLELDIEELRGSTLSGKTHGPGGVAALYATSGSTGEPKIVALSHRAILFDIGRQTNDLYLGQDDRFDALFSNAFSASLATNFGALLNGAELHCYDTRHSMATLPAWLAHSGITISTMTVSMLRNICLPGNLAPRLPAMRLLSVGGEAVHPADVEAFRSVFPSSCVLQNAMASTESRTYVQYFVPSSEPVESPVPIGFPVAGKEVLLLSEDGSLVGPGCEGEIAVRSRYLAEGYMNDAMLTATKFQAQEDGTVLYRTGDRGIFRPDGCLVFLGRTDAQAKIRGYRVELDHIAQMVELHPDVQTAVVAAWAESGVGDQLVAYVVAHASRNPTEKLLREFLRTQLPEYCIPSKFIFLPELPINVNFKVDRKKLPQPLFFSTEEDAVSSNKAIEQLRNIWQLVLQRSDIGDNDSFTDLGGDSLSAVRILVAINERFARDLPPDALYRFPTLKLLAGRISDEVQTGSKADSVTIFRSGGSGCPIFFVPGLNGSTAGYGHLADHIDSDHAVYGLNTESWFTATTGVSVESMAMNYAAQIEAMVPAGGKVVIAGHSFGGTLAFEVASQLRRKGTLDPLPVIIDMPALNAPGCQPNSLPHQMVDALFNLPAWIATEMANFRPRALALRSWGNIRRIARALGGRPPARELDPNIYFGETNLPEAYQSFLTAMYQALLRYVPTRYEGKVTLLRAKVPTLFRSHDVSMGWEAVVVEGNLEVCLIPGRHDDCISERYAGELSAILAGCTQAFISGE